ncbi:MAG TPA: ATP-binding protein [Nitrospinaceae bacterium]|jgi:signal transduction histidine kinase|nr:ATP-binding protein [Nitrospinaceae bacterium]|tara:strand:+ start:524 stop:778 length:255 start_codon:yes stop_codon:yes gene_type:complete
MYNVKIASLATITIQDNGIGFDPKYLNKIFKPFEPLHRAAEFEGNGMGLTICRKIVELHGGRISADSIPGEGFIFTITLPQKNS